MSVPDGDGVGLRMESSSGGESELSRATVQSFVNAVHNATVTQQQLSITSQAALTMAVATLFSVDTAAIGAAEKQAIARVPASGQAEGS